MPAGKTGPPPRPPTLPATPSASTAGTSVRLAERRSHASRRQEAPKDSRWPGRGPGGAGTTLSARSPAWKSGTWAGRPGTGWTEAAALAAAVAIAVLATPAGIWGAVLLPPFQVSVLGRSARRPPGEPALQRGRRSGRTPLVLGAGADGASARLGAHRRGPLPGVIAGPRGHPPSLPQRRAR